MNDIVALQRGQFSLGVDNHVAIFYQFHAQKVLFKVPKICNINFWIENDPPLRHFSKNSSDLVARSFPNDIFTFFHLKTLLFGIE